MSDLWQNERRLWIEGVEAYEELMWTECIMAFGPMGIMRNEQIVESLREAPRWSHVEITNEVRTTPAENFALLVYNAKGTRDGVDPYEAICTSSYVCVDGYWWLTHHQQTPVSS